MPTAAQLLVQCLELQGVKRIFGIPGAKIDAVFNALVDSSIELTVCRHEQNAAFMAAAYGRLSGQPGVVLVTSGPGISNLSTGLLTATTEGDPVIALGGNVARNMHLKRSHQNCDNVALMSPVCKSSVEITAVENIPEALDDAFRLAMRPMRGACFISLPQDLIQETTELSAPPPTNRTQKTQATAESLKEVANTLQAAKQAVLILGQEASRPENTLAIRRLLSQHRLAVVSTFQAAGVISRELLDCFVGRVGLFKNQPGDLLLDKADCVLTVGYNPVEYDPEIWNVKADKTIIHIDDNPAAIHLSYRPQMEVLGDIASNLAELCHHLPLKTEFKHPTFINRLHQEIRATIESGQEKTGYPIHPLRFIHELRQLIDDDTLVTCDVGTVYMWMARYFLSFEPHRLLFSNGQQTLGVALPWAMAANYVYPDKQILSISGDGGFLFSAMELETAVREKLNFVHCIWRDGAYNMVEEQEVMKYGRKSGVDFGRINVIDFAKAFGAHGYEIQSADEIAPTLTKAMGHQGPVLIDIPIDYSDNPDLFQVIDSTAGH